MIEIFKKQIILFWRNKTYKNTILCLFICVLFALLFFLKNDADFLYLFYIIVRFNYYFMLIYGTIAFLYFREDKNYKLNECITSIDHNSNTYLKVNYIIIILVLLLFNILLIILLLFSAYINKQIYLFYNCVSQYYLLNVLFPQILTVTICAIISKIKQNKTSFILFTCFMILISPYIELLQWSTKPLIPIDSIVNFIVRPFSIFYQNSNWTIDHLYGYQNEIYKVSIIFFWNVVLLIILFHNKLKRQVQYISVCLSMVIFISIFIPQSSCRINKKWNDTYSDLNYYGIFENQSNYKKDTANEFDVKNYDLKIDIKSKLFVKGTITASTNEPTDHFVFTLYHGYKVKKLKSDNLIYYEQNGDYIDIFLKNKVFKEKIIIEYNGYHPSLYSNYQAVQLPGYFAWYPMPGKRQLYITFGESAVSNYGYNPYNRVNSEYRIQINTKYPIITNLEQLNNNIYEGKSDSLTLIGGNLEKTDNKFINYFPLNLSNELNASKYIEMLNENWNSVISKIEEIYSVKLDFKNKKILVLSNGIGRISNLGNYAEFNDYIVVANDGFLSDSDLLMYYIFTNEEINQEVKDNLVLLGSINQNYKSLFESLNENIENENVKKELNQKNDNKSQEDYFKKLGLLIWGGKNN